MPLGPRPEPPKAVKKDNTHFEPDLAYHEEPSYNPYVNGSPSRSHSTTSISSKPMGPRPISARKPVKLPYPINTHKETQPQSPQTPVTPIYPLESSMPEPEFVRMPTVRRAKDLIPSKQTQRDTKSIFQWGIPSELLPPMPLKNNLLKNIDGELSMSIDLPEVPLSDQCLLPFSAEQLTVSDFQKINDIWSLSQLSNWIAMLVHQFDSSITYLDVQNALTKLFMFRIPALLWLDAERISLSVMQSFELQKFILNDEKFSLQKVEVNGVVTLISGCDGCYSSNKPFLPVGTCCYSSRCLREPRIERIEQVKKRGVNVRVPSVTRARVPSNSNFNEELFDPFANLEMNWRKYWHLEESDLTKIDSKLIKMQFAYHELILSEVAFVRDIRIYLDVYGDIELLKDLQIMKNQAEFSRKVFGTLRAVLKVNMKLLTHLLAEQTEQGPFVHTLNNWITQFALDPETISAYTQYAHEYLWADSQLRTELSTNQRLQKWMEERAKDPRLTGRPHSFFFHRVLPRVARYHLLLTAIKKYTPQDAQTELKQIDDAILACTKLTQLCDDKVAKQKEIQDVQNLKAHIVFKSSEVTADLKLNDKRRKLLRRGNLVRKGDMRMEWVDTHALLLDNFFVMSKTREGMNGTALYVTKPPIPLDLLVLEQVNEDAVTKVGSKLTLVRHVSDLSVDDNDSDETDKNQPLFPIRIAHLGANKQVYVLFAPNQVERSHWVKALVQAKQARAQLAFARSAEPLKLVKISDRFAYPENETPVLPVPIPDTALHRAVGNIDGIERIILRRKVQCMQSAGKLFFTGTDFGLWLGCEVDNGEIEFSRVLAYPQRVVKLDILDSMNLLVILCGDHNLIWYPLDQIIAIGLGDARKCFGTRLNQHKKVLDFHIAYHKGRVVLMYLQQGGVLKVIEPIRSHGASAMANLTEAGLITTASCVDSFREIDRMQVPNDTVRITAFLKSFVLSTQRSFEWATLDTKNLKRIPTGKLSKEMQHWGRPIRIIKLDANQVLLCYETCYVICDVNGQIGMQPTTWFLEKVVDCCYYAPYLILFSAFGEFIEVRYVDEFPGRLVQIITGKDIKLLSNSDDRILIRMAHPWVSGRQLILELVGNEVVRDNVSTYYSSSSGA